MPERSSWRPRPDGVLLHGPDGKVRQAEIDTNLDKVIDRWERFDDGDGKVDRSEPLMPGP